MADLRALARAKAKRYGLDPHIFERQIQQESGFNPNIRSPAGASGIAQIMPATARGWGVDPLNPAQALDAAAKNMASYVRKYGGYENALRAYNAGPGAIQKSKGYAETNNYVKTILGGRSPRGGGTKGSANNIGQEPGSSLTIPGFRQGAVRLPSVGGSQVQITEPQVDQAGYDDARRRSVLGAMIARHNPNSLLLRTGLLSTEAPRLSDFVTDKTSTVKIPGIPGVTIPGGKLPGMTIIKAGSGYPLGRPGKIIGTPHKGTHTLGNWESDNAVDIAVPAGTPMVAIDSGRVVKVTRHPQNGGRFAGDQITIRGAHGNSYFYAHGTSSVKAGQRVKAGQVIGRSGSANGVAHLHLGIQHGQPQKIISAARSGGGGGGGGGAVPSGGGRQVVNGKPVTSELARAVAVARQHGWRGTVTSGIRSRSEQMAAATRFGLSHYGPAGPLGSNHVEGHSGALDVSDPDGFEAALRRAKRSGYKGRLPFRAMKDDPVHFSWTGH